MAVQPEVLAHVHGRSRRARPWAPWPVTRSCRRRRSSPRRRSRGATPVRSDGHARGRAGARDAVSWGVVPPDMRCAFQVVPPSVVATITALPAADAFGPATPTAQQRRASGTTPRRARRCRPVRADRPPAVCPSARRARGRPGGVGWPVSAQPDTGAASQRAGQSGRRRDARHAGAGHEAWTHGGPTIAVGGNLSVHRWLPSLGGLGRPAHHGTDAAGRRPRASSGGDGATPDLRRLLPGLRARYPAVGPAARTGHETDPLGRRGGAGHAHGLPVRRGRAGARDLEQRDRAPPPPGNVDSALGVGVAVVAVLLSAWLVAA